MQQVTRSAGVLVSAAIVFLLICGCAKAPDKQISDAKTALQAAEQLEADNYMPEQYAKAADAIDSAQAEIENQSKAFPLTRKYTQAERYLDVALSLTDKMKSGVADAKEAMKTDVEAGITAVKEQLEATRAEVKKAPRSKVKDSLDEINGQLDAAQGALEQAETSIGEGNYYDADKKIGKAKKSLKKVSDMLSTGGAAGLM
ncbi:MAG: DUF4398 domain-containing protein [Chitinivibrionales bacterium]|nr:DUF4398 domain-containing protein [Chitinivibrionales bacterium]